MNDAVLPRPGAARFRTALIRLGALITAISALASTPALADGGGTTLAHAPGEKATIRDHAASRRRRVRRRTASRCPDADARLGSVPRTDTEGATLCLLNLQRSSRGLPNLHASDSLDLSAQRWTETMVHDRAFSHGSDFGARISAAGFRWSRIGENIAAGYHTPSSAVVAWMHSLGHCENILSPEFREVGAGFASAATGGPAMRRGTWTLDFGLRLGQRTPSRDWTPAEHCPE